MVKTIWIRFRAGMSMKIRIAFRYAAKCAMLFLYLILCAKKGVVMPSMSYFQVYIFQRFNARYHGLKEREQFWRRLIMTFFQVGAL